MFKYLASSALVVAFASSSFAGFEVLNVLGDLQDSSSNSLSVGSFWDGNATLRASGGVGSASTTFTTDWRDGSSFSAERSILQFKANEVAAGNINYSLPSDRNGGFSSAAAGESRYFGTWDNDSNPSSYDPGHKFSMGIDVTDGDGYVGVERKDVSQFVYNYSSSTGASHTNIDNSSIDLDPTVGHITIDKTVTHSFNVSAVLGAVDVTRPLATFSDGTQVASPFYDEAYTGEFFYLAGSDGYVPAHAYGDNSTDSQFYKPGDDDTVVKSFGNRTGGAIFDLTDPNAKEGKYTLILGSVLWNPMRDDQNNSLGSGYYGNFLSDVQFVDVTIVPEPASLIALGLGALTLVRKRAKK